MSDLVILVHQFLQSLVILVVFPAKALQFLLLQSVEIFNFFDLVNQVSLQFDFRLRHVLDVARHFVEVFFEPVAL